MTTAPTLTAAEVANACQAGASEAAAAFQRALAVQADIAVGEPSTLYPNRWPEGLAGPGLVLVFRSGASAAAVLVPESTGLVPGWCASPNPTEQSRLSTLAQELAVVLLPEQFLPDDSKAGYSADLRGALVNAGVTGEVSAVSLEFIGKHPQAFLVWPIPNPERLLAQGTPSGQPQGVSVAPGIRAEATASRAPRSPSTPKLHGSMRRQCSLEELPSYSRSLLRVRVPVVVTLASERQPIHRILEIAPGSIIQFDKSCEEMLQLAVADRVIAEGEAVKIGDKFGLRITSIVLPEERFYPLRAAQAD